MTMFHHRSDETVEMPRGCLRVVECVVADAHNRTNRRDRLVCRIVRDVERNECDDRPVRVDLVLVLSDEIGTADDGEVCRHRNNPIWLISDELSCGLVDLCKNGLLALFVGLGRDEDGDGDDEVPDHRHKKSLVVVVNDCSNQNAYQHRVDNRYGEANNG